MPESLRCVPPNALIAGWDFSTGSVKCLAFDLNGAVVAEVRLPTDLWTEGGVSELNLMQLEGQARASTRAMAAKLKALGRDRDWIAGGVSATHHSAGRIDAVGNQVRRAICWNDQTLAGPHAEGLQRLGGPDKPRELTGGPWAVRYSLSHLVKDEQTLTAADWKRTKWILPHGPLAAGYLTGRFDCISVSSAASTGILDLRTNQWRKEMLNALADPAHRDQAWENLPDLIDMATPIGKMADYVALEAGLPFNVRPFVFPTLDDQAAGLIGGGAVDAGQVAIILGNSAVVNSSSAILPQSGSLDAMRLNWGPFLWMRCYSNGAQFLDRVVGPDADWTALEAAARAVSAGANGTEVLPFVLSEPSIGVTAPRVTWFPEQPKDVGVRVRASFEALAYLIALAVKEHEAAGQKITRVTISGGIAKSELMGEILASVLNRPLERLVSSEGPALGAAAAALAGLETHLRGERGIRERYTVADAVAAIVKFRAPVVPRPEWVPAYQTGLKLFADRVRG
ncbi:xylulokinase [Fimbriiglobus ruber]|uniref:Xylulose kinase n=1 Tax=Fimbriiglobus ruber TaxID=1908690 RepID=A0A225DUV1_9BACT|nr:FGGY family carbohydrate kinase [Fimbriiglobus ruber]OWK43424.1 Xylulose kinase [Fimbriiglobus ruber]